MNVTKCQMALIRNCQMVKHEEPVDFCALDAAEEARLRSASTIQELSQRLLDYAAKEVHKKGYPILGHRLEAEPGDGYVRAYVIYKDQECGTGQKKALVALAGCPSDMPWDSNKVAEVA